jgi:nickel transport system ATP-binding protein
VKYLLKVENLTVTHKYNNKEINIVDNVSLTVERGRCLGILGESGSGKSMTCKAITGLLDKNFNITGKAVYKYKDLITESKENLRRLRGKEICMILQNPMTSFDPLYPMERQMSETFQEHTSLSKREIREKMLEGLALMQIKNSEEVLKKYPHQLSGGMLQRIMISLALSLEPDLIIADEPTTAIDAITQYEIINEFLEIKKRNKSGMIFISHDLGVINSIADDVIVMHRGSVVDAGPIASVLQGSKNPYTQLLIENKRIVMKKFEEILGGAGGDRK